MLSGLAVVVVAGWLLVSNLMAAPVQAPSFRLSSTGYERGVQGDPVNFTLEDYRGKTLVLDFMAVACASCRVVTQETLLPLHLKLVNRTDFAIVSVDVWASAPGAGFGETREELIRLQKEEGTPWRHALDTDGMMQKYGAIGIPLLTVIDPEGRITYQANGVPDPSRVEAAVQAAMAGTAGTVRIVQTGVLGLAFLAGLGAMLAPCSVGLLPAYMSQLVKPREGGDVRAFAAIRRGLEASLGVVVLYLLLALALIAFGPTLRNNLEWGGLVVAVAMLGLGLASLAGLSWGRFVPRLGFQPKGMFGFGLAYGTAAFACTGPIFIPVMAAAFLEGTVLGLASLVAYASGVCLLLVGVAYLVATGRAAGLNRILPRTAVLSRITGVLLILAGAYLFWFYGRAGILPWQ